MPPKNETLNLYDRLGGSAAIDAVVDLFYNGLLSDELLRPFFEDIDVESLRKKQRIFLAVAFGARTRYDGRALRDAHAHLVDRGLNENHFMAVGMHLHATLFELGVDKTLIDEVMAIVVSTRDEILGR